MAGLRVLVVSDFFPPAPGGMERHVEALADVLTARRHEVRVVTTGPAEGIGPHPYQVEVAALRFGGHRWPSPRTGRAFPPPWPDAGLVGCLERAVALVRPDVVHAHGWCAYSASRVGRRAGVPVVVTLHDYGFLCPLRTLVRGGRICGRTAGPGCVWCPGANQGVVRRTGLAAALQVQGDVGAAALIAVSDAIRDRYERAGVRPVPVVVENMVAPPDPPAGPVPAGGSVLFVGSDAPNKGLAVLLRAVAAAPWSSAHQVVVVGTAERGVVDGVRFTGRLDGPALEAEFRAAAVVVVPSVWEEPGPLVALEAMAFGRPLLGSAVGGMRTAVVPGVTGRLVAPGDAGALRRALGDMLADPGELVRMGAAAEERARRYAPDVIGGRIEEVYRSVLS